MADQGDAGQRGLLPADITLIEQIREELARQAANNRMGR